MAPNKTITRSEKLRQREGLVGCLCASMQDYKKSKGKKKWQKQRQAEKKTKKQKELLNEERQRDREKYGQFFYYFDNSPPLSQEARFGFPLIDDQLRTGWLMNMQTVIF